MKKGAKIVIALLLAIIVACVGYIAYDVISKEQRGNVYDELQATAVKKIPETKKAPEEQVEIPIDFAALQAQNPDIYAWIQIEGTNINYPILQSATDDGYYLDYTADHQYGLPGSIYTEGSVNTKEFTEFNTLIYGHDMRDGSMFQNLHKYTDETFMDEHRTVIIYTPEKKLTYQIFAAVVYDDRHIMHSFDFQLEGERQAFLDSIEMQRDFGNIVKNDVEVTPDSRIITMSTCMTGQDDKRFIVGAVLVNEEG